MDRDQKLSEDELVDGVAQAIAECDVFTFHNSPDYSRGRPMKEQANAEEWREIARAAIKRLDELAMASRGDGTLGKAAPDEPVFILRAKDQFAPRIVDQWVALVQNSNIGENYLDARDAKIREARALSHEMRAWQERHGCKVPD